MNIWPGCAHGMCPLRGVRASLRRMASATAVAMVLSACSANRDINLPTVGMRSSSSSASSSSATIGYSPRVVTGAAIPPGGGNYKLGQPYRMNGNWYVPREEPGYDRIGTASWYGADFHGRRTANGEIYNMNALSAAHPTLPLPSYVTVTNLANNRKVMLRVNDRGPYVAGRLIDLSRAAAQALGYDNHGTAQVRIRYAGRAPLNGDDSRERQFLAQQSGRHDALAAAQWSQPAKTLPAWRTGPAPQPVPSFGPSAPAATGWSPDAYRRGQIQSPPAKPATPAWSSNWGLGSTPQ